MLTVAEEILESWQAPIAVDVKFIGAVALEVTYKDSLGRLGNELIYRDREPSLEIVEAGRPWSFDGDSALFRLVSEANRIRLAHLFDPLLAVHTSLLMLSGVSPCWMAASAMRKLKLPPP